MNPDSNEGIVLEKRLPSDGTSGARRSNLLVVAKGASVSFFGSWVGQAATFLSGLLLARALGPHEYGLYAQGLTVVSTLWGLAVFGLPSAAQPYFALYAAALTRKWPLLSLAPSGEKAG